MHTPTNTDTEKPCGELDINETLRQMIQNGMLNEALDFCKVFVKNGHINKEIYIFYVLLLIRQKELENHQPQTFDLSNNPDVLIQHYHVLKFLIRRLEFPQMEPIQNELFSYCKETNSSLSSLEIIAHFSTMNPDAVIAKIKKGLHVHE